MQRQISYYETLDVSPQASDDEIKKAYRKQAMKYHPDLNPHDRNFCEYQFRLISEAYAGLKTKEKRAQYNRALKAGNDNENMSWFARIFRTEKEKSR